MKITFQPNTPKYLSVANAIMEAIRDGIFSLGEQLPSINELSDEYFISRDTVEKAYKELRRQNILKSVKGKGYFISRIDVNAPVRILLIFNKISNYKKQIYNSFIETLGPNATVRLQIHHSNVKIFEDLIKNNTGMYDYYLVMPHFYDQQEKAMDVLRSVPKEKLILLDKDFPDFGDGYSAVYQDFKNDIIGALESAKPYLKKYEKLVYVNPEIVPYPPEIMSGFKSFCVLNDFDYSIIGDMDTTIPVVRGDAYLVIEEADLATLIKICKSQNLKIGKDVGIISYNDTPLKEILLEGITVISTDHEKMGKAAANIILNKQTIKFKNPFTLIIRKSL